MTTAPTSLLQRLLAACRRAFRGPGTVPAPDDVALIRGILGTYVHESNELGMHLFATLFFFSVAVSHFKLLLSNEHCSDLSLSLNQNSRGVFLQKKKRTHEE
jgi:hypothetical protein